MKTALSTPATRSLPPAGTVHLWHIRLSGVDPALRIHLSPDELDYGTTLACRSEGEAFMSIRCVLRELLSSYFDCSAAELSFVEDAPGQLRLVKPETLLRFHLSHCDDLLLVAVTFARHIGIDVEYMRPDLPFETLADHYFDPKDAWHLRLLGPGEKMRHFYEYWTSSEAQRYATTADQSPAKSHAARPCWATLNFSPADGFSAALSVEGERFQLNCISW